MSNLLLARRLGPVAAADLAGETNFTLVSEAQQGGSLSREQSGYGRCSISGCYCQEYAGQGYTCENCGHNYASHW
jgi:hypothetical protein